MSRFTKITIFLFSLAATLWFYAFFALGTDAVKEPGADSGGAQISKPAASGTSTLPLQKVLSNDYHVYQTFNNCAPAALSMAFSYYGIKESQESLAAELRPFNNLNGKNDDKSTPPPELAEAATKRGLSAYFRPGGDIELVKQFIANDIPVVTRTLLYPDQDYAHYRVIKGYDEKRKEIIQDDALEGKNKRFSYDEFLARWRPFNYAYLVMVTPEKESVAEKIIGENVNKQTAWRKAASRAEEELRKKPDDLDARFNLSVAHYYTGNYRQAAAEFEKIENRLPRHTIWYQIEPIQAYFALGNYDRVFALSDRILNDNNKAFTELYLLKGQSYLKQGKTDLAKAEFEKAVLYNKNSAEAKNALAALSGR